MAGEAEIKASETSGNVFQIRNEELCSEEAIMEAKPEVEIQSRHLDWKDIFCKHGGLILETVLFLSAIIQGLPWIILSAFRDPNAPEGISPVTGARVIRNTIIWVFIAFMGAVNSVIISYLVVIFVSFCEYY